MKRIIASLAVVALMSLAAVGATRAFFSDTETSEDNVLSAGTLDLTVDGYDDPDVVHIEISDLAPGWGGNYYWVLRNAGSVSGQPYLEFSTLTENENGVIEPEAGAAGENGGEPGELADILYTNVYWRQGSGSWNRICVNNNAGNSLLNALDSKIVGLGAFNTGYCSDVKLPVLAAGEEVEIRLHPWWHVDPGIDHNKAQTDSVEFDITFHLDQE
jgi:predicted ribosomally synthesized peptide with SipW-like signal peptide